uniref:Uncharacterized protein n=1 Tax=Saimiri boliviensis boliviensis TaxID=39432 RepID=A0A2K6SV88_SAIBB
MAECCCTLPSTCHCLGPLHTSATPVAPAGVCGSLEYGGEVTPGPTGIDVLVAPASHLPEETVCFPRFAMPSEGLRSGVCHTLLLTSNCHCDQGLGAYIFLHVFISLTCVDLITLALPSWKGLVTPQMSGQLQGRRRNRKSPFNSNRNKRND